MTRLAGRPAPLLGAVLAICVFAIGFALVSQHVHDMQPCPWCVLQRLIYALIGLAALLGLLWRRRPGPQVGAGLVLLLTAAGVATALWQHFVAAASASCNLTLADRIISGLKLDELAPEVFQARASCADAAVSMAGVPYEFWSLALYLVLAAIALRALTRSR